MNAHHDPSRAVMRAVERAVRQFRMLPDGASVAVGLSGGKDSFLLHACLRALQARGDLNFRLTAVHLDQHQPGFDRPTFDASLATQGIDCHVVSKDTWSVVASKLGPTDIPCALCSRMRRGVLLAWCKEQGHSHLALGHHLDDAVETFFMNLFFGRRLEPMRAVTPSDNTGVTVIRPLLLVEEAKVIAWARQAGVATVDCPVCSSYPRSQRQRVGEMVAALRTQHPDLDASVRAALYGNDATATAG